MNQKGYYGMLKKHCSFATKVENWHDAKDRINTKDSLLDISLLCFNYSNSQVTLQSEGNISVRVIGLDDYGYLLVETSSGERISVQPDGNSFDMMKNLIAMKLR